LLNNIPEVNKIFLSKILLFLYKISLNSEKNLMTTENLSVCLTFRFFGEPLPQEDLQKAAILLIKETPAAQRCFKLMIEENENLISSINQQTSNKEQD